MNAPRDENFKPTLAVVLNTNGTTIVLPRINPSTHRLRVSNGTTGSDHGPKNALRDENGVPVLMGVSSVDFKTPVVVYGDNNGEILIQST